MDVANRVNMAFADANHTLSFATEATVGQVRSLVSDFFAQWSTTQLVVTFVMLCVAYDQIMYIWRKGPIAGPMFKIPFMGPFIQALHPQWDGYVAQWNSGKLSCVSVFHKFVVMVADRDLAHKVFKSPNFASPCLVPVAKDILRPGAFVLLMGKAHAEFRRGLTMLFTNRALSIYLPRQEAVFEDYFNRWVEDSKAAGGKPIKFFAQFREVNSALSCRTFFGDYISGDEIKHIADNFYIITAALELVNVPGAVYIPFTKPWRGKKVAGDVLKVFQDCAAKSKANMEAGAEPTCTVDEWVAHMIASENYRKRVAAGEENVEKPVNMIRDFSTWEMAQTMFTFLFASQDASSSATIWMFQVLAQRPDVLDKVREENLRVRGGDKTVPYTLEIFEKLTYTNAVVKELLRWRPPVIFIPYNVNKDYPITPEYTIPKGSMVIPSAYPALSDPAVYPNPETFDPDRWITGDAETKTRNWLVFGAGAHDCLARKYVPLSMALMIGKASMEIDWVHHPTPLSEKIRVFACLFPDDECPLVFTKRE